MSNTRPSSGTYSLGSLQTPAIIAVVLVPIFLSACVPMGYVKSGAQQVDFDKDSYACLKENKDVVQTVGSIYSSIYSSVSRATADCDAVEACMAARGWSFTENGQFQPRFSCQK